MHDRDQVATIIEEYSAKKDHKSDFTWQMYMKFHYELPKEEVKAEEVKALNPQRTFESELLESNKSISRPEDYKMEIKKQKENKNMHIRINILNAERNYGYEYLGNTSR